jgi:hypothetical protein
MQATCNELLNNQGGVYEDKSNAAVNDLRKKLHTFPNNEGIPKLSGMSLHCP